MSFTFDTVCESDTTHFTDSSTTVPPLGGPISTYDWDMGGTGTYVLPTNNTSVNPQFIYDNAGVYQVILTVTDINGCQGYDTNTVIVDTLPIANFSATEVCHNDTTVFMDSSIGLSLIHI